MRQLDAKLDAFGSMLAERGPVPGMTFLVIIAVLKLSFSTERCLPERLPGAKDLMPARESPGLIHSTSKTKRTGIALRSYQLRDERKLSSCVRMKC